jgi:uncharacterized RDD family membrane protein YckC
MKCPKCGYLGFEQVDRCRNCGYEFSLSSSSAIQELPVRTDTPVIGPLDDLALDARADPRPSGVSTEIGPDLDRAFNTPHPPESGPSELPLFGSPTGTIGDDTPLITKPSPPRTPLAVRRSSPEVPRVRAGPIRAASLDLGLDLDGPAAGYTSVAPSAADQAQETLARPVGQAAIVAAGLGARAAAVTIDLLVLGAIDAAVVYFTMQICGVTIEEFAIIPHGPLLAFLVVQNVGYLVAFTAGGQTLGKMAAGIKVVAAESNRSIDVGRALKRTVAWLLLAIPAGLGFLTALASRDRRGLHDRFAGTRVVRASA